MVMGGFLLAAVIGFAGLAVDGGLYPQPGSKPSSSCG
jgi:hypothetical protein